MTARSQPRRTRNVVEMGRIISPKYAIANTASSTAVRGAVRPKMARNPSGATTAPTNIPPTQFEATV